MRRGDLSAIMTLYLLSLPGELCLLCSWWEGAVLTVLWEDSGCVRGVCPPVRGSPSAPRCTRSCWVLQSTLGGPIAGARLHGVGGDAGACGSGSVPLLLQAGCPCSSPQRSPSARAWGPRPRKPAPLTGAFPWCGLSCQLSCPGSVLSFCC